MNEPKLNKRAYWPVAIIVISLIFLIGSSSIDNLPLQTKIGFIGKIGLIVGVISLWLFTILPIGKKKS